MEIHSKLLDNMKIGKEFISKMDSVFRELRADFDVASLEHSKKKIEELKRVHIDTTGAVSTLANLSTGSNGLVKGLRGTGKSHLLLLARNEINLKKASICIYVNLKEHLNIGGITVVEERFYVWAILKQLKEQLNMLVQDINNDEKEEWLEMLLRFFGKSKDKKAQNKLNMILSTIDTLLLEGDKEMLNFSSVRSSSTQSELTFSDESGLTLDSSKVSLAVKSTDTEKESLKYDKQYNTTTFLNLSSLKTLLIQVVEVLGLDSIVFFYDEWSILENKDQIILSRLIRALSTSPIFHWIAYIPYKSSLGVLEKTADMPHQIELDLQYIFEENNEVCKMYFTQFTNKRLEVVFGSNDFDIYSLIRPEYLNLVIMSCMGNTRDFGLILNKAWILYKQDYIVNGKKRTINKSHIVKAIKAVADEKLSNLQAAGNKYSEKLWSEILKFIGEKKHTHFCIELNKQNINFIGDKEFEELLYHRLVHLRKKDLPPKDGEEFRLSMYAVDVSSIFSRIFETRSELKKIKPVTDINIIHNQIRRYVFDLSSVINEFRIEQGKQIICAKCKRPITEDMGLAWELGACPYCKTPFIVHK